MGEDATMRSGYLLLVCGLIAGCGTDLSTMGEENVHPLPGGERREADVGIGVCYPPGGPAQQFCDQNSPPPGTSTACCSEQGGVSYCCPTGTTICCPGADTVLTHCCNAGQTCQIVGNVSTFYDAYCVPAVCGG